jgi:hypothetical protein
MLQETDKILYVGFKGKNNSSFKLVDSMKGDHLFLTNSFEGVYRRKISTSTERITENFFITAFADTPYPPTVLHPHILDGRNYL